METLIYLPFLVIIISDLAVMFRLMHYARFYTPSYLFRTGAIVMLAGLISLIHPPAFLFITAGSSAVTVGSSIPAAPSSAGCGSIWSEIRNRKVKADG